MYPKQRQFTVPMIGRGLLPYLAILCCIGFSFWALSPALAHADDLPERSGVSIENSPQEHGSLTGTQAIEHLKASGEYASLQLAFQQAQRGVDAIDATSDFRFDTYLKASNTKNDAWFGTALALSGNTVAIAAPSESSRFCSPATDTSGCASSRRSSPEDLVCAVAGAGTKKCRKRAVLDSSKR